MALSEVPRMAAATLCHARVREAASSTASKRGGGVIEGGEDVLRGHSKAAPGGWEI